MKIGGSLGKWSNEAKGAVRDAGQMADQFYKNTIGDITDSLGNISQCLASLDKIRIRVMERTIEYHTAALRVLIRSNYVEQEIIETVWHMVKNDIRRSPEPAIYHLPNPKSSVGAKKIDIESHVFPKNKYPSILVHGMGYNASLDDAYSFYRDFEDHVDVFSDSRYADHDIYLVSYDTELTDESDSIIRAAIELLLGMIPGGDLEPLVLGVFWRELERRASLTGDYIFPFLKRIKQEVPTALGFAVTHSLGCFTLASASQKLLSENRNNKIFSKWLCMAAALPAMPLLKQGVFR
ncbi:hypothetical protein ACFWMP_15080 [Paenibacillus sp. NPDC058367]|uniref:hypothetical protein n=1 Tax=Paenibacillus sp. NPDC058367 TaxID=3346460 RepID=UPI00364AC034